MIKLLLHWFRPAPVSREARPDLADADPDDRPLGCGWFDSSHELQQGLLVTEHACADAVAGELPLSDWLALHLSGWRAQPAVCRA